MKSRRRGKDEDEDLGEFEYTSNYGDADPIPDSAMKVKCWAVLNLWAVFELVC